MIPSKVKIGGIEYSVEEKEVVIIDGNSNYAGKVDYLQAAIEILKDSPEQRKEETLIHEIMHAVFFESGCSIENEEEVVSRASRVLYQVLKDNKLYFGDKSDETECKINCALNLDSRAIANTVVNEIKRKESIADKIGRPY